MARASKKLVAEQPSGRWFRVTAERYDWIIKHGVMRCYRHGQIAFGTRACIKAGISINAIELIDKPEGAKAGKDGRVTFGD